MSEIWKDIPGYEGYYQISSFGNVKSLKRTKVLGLKGTRVVPEKLLVLHKDGPNGYYQVQLIKNGVRKMAKVHKLVATCFIPPVVGMPWINHIDGNKLNNHISNLEPSNPSHNQKHAYDNGLRRRITADRNPNTKLTPKNVKQIKALLNSGEKRLDVASMFGVSLSTIKQIKSGRTWKSVDVLKRLGEL